MSGLRQVVLALLTLSNDGCRSLRRHSVAAESAGGEDGGEERGGERRQRRSSEGNETRKRLAKEEMKSV